MSDSIKKFEEMNSNEINKDINFYNNLHLKVNEINRKNDLINEKYNRDYKFTRVHKRIMENQNYSKNEILLFDILNDVKLEIDQQSLINSQILDNKNYFKKVTMPIIISKFNKLPASNVTINDAEYLNNLVANEYLDEFSQKILN
jgi:type I restriction enzyme R subunit